MSDRLETGRARGKGKGKGKGNANRREQLGVRPSPIPKSNDTELPEGWYSAANPKRPHTSANPAVYYYTGDNLTQWDLPTRPSRSYAAAVPKATEAEETPTVVHPSLKRDRSPATKRPARAKRAGRKRNTKHIVARTPTFAGIDFGDEQVAAFFNGAEPPWWCVGRSLPYIGYILGTLPAGHPLLQPGRPPGPHAGYGGNTAKWQSSWPASWHHDSDGPDDAADATSDASQRERERERERERAAPLPRASNSSARRQATPAAGAVSTGARAPSSGLSQRMIRAAQIDIRERPATTGSLDDAMLAAHYAKVDADAAAKEQKRLDRDIERAIALSLQDCGASPATASFPKRGKGNDKAKAKACTAGLQDSSNSVAGKGAGVRAAAGRTGVSVAPLRTRRAPKMDGGRSPKRVRASNTTPTHHIPFVGATVKADWGPDYPDPETGSTIYTGTVIEYVHGEEKLPSKAVAKYAPTTEHGTVYHGWWKIEWSDGDINDNKLSDLMPKLDMAQPGPRNSQALIGCKVCKIGTAFNDNETDGTTPKLMVGSVTDYDPKRGRWTVMFQNAETDGLKQVTELVALPKLAFLFNPVVGLSYSDLSGGKFREGSITKYLGNVGDSDQVMWEASFAPIPSEGFAGATKRINESSIRAYTGALSLSTRRGPGGSSHKIDGDDGDASSSDDESYSLVLTTTEEGQTPNDLARIEGFDVDAFVKLNRVRLPSLGPNTPLKIGTGPLVLPKPK